MRTTIAYGSTGVANNLLPTSVEQGSGASPTMAVTAIAYTPDGDVGTVDGPLAGTDDITVYRYDSARQLVGLVGPDPDGVLAGLNRAHRMTLNSRGQVTKLEAGTTVGQSDGAWAAFNPLIAINSSYDNYGRLLMVEQPNGSAAPVSQEQWSYDAAGRMLCGTVRMTMDSTVPADACTPETSGSFGPDRIVRMTYDSVGRAATTTTAYGLSEEVTESVSYTANGQVAQMTDGNSNVSIIEYDGFNRPSRLRFPNASGGGTSTTDYEQVGYDAASNVVSSRNRAGLTATIVYDALNRPTLVDAPSGTEDVSTTYDNIGRVLTTSSLSQTSTNTWDSLSRLTSEVGPLGALSYQHNAAGRMIRTSWPDGFYALYDRDLYGALTAIRENGATSSLATYSHNDLGQRAGIVRENGVSTLFSYDAASRLAGLSHNAPGSAYDVAFTFSHNPAGQIVSRAASNAGYIYAPVTGTAAYVNDGRNAVVSVGGSAVSYDADQNIASATGNSFAYDAAGRLTSATVGGTGYAFTYDANGRLYSGSGARFLYAGVQLVGEYDSSGVLLARHIPGPGLDQPVASLIGSSKVQQIADERGSVIGTGDMAGVVSISRYDEYGVPSAADRFQYTGQALMAPGLYNYRSRVYAPQLGRFLQPDPLGYGSGSNLSGYVWADPVNLSDPYGDHPLLIAAGVGFLISGGLEAWSQYNGDGLSWSDWDEIGIQGAIGAGGAVVGAAAAARAALVFTPIVANAIGGAIGGGVGGGAGAGYTSYDAGNGPRQTVANGLQGAGLGAIFGGLGGATGGSAFSGPAFSRAESGFRPLVQWTRSAGPPRGALAATFGNEVGSGIVGSSHEIGSRLPPSRIIDPVWLQGPPLGSNTGITGYVYCYESGRCYRVVFR